MTGRLQKFLLGGIVATVALQIYFFRELLATLVLVGIVFTAFATLVLTLKALYWIYDRTYAGAEALVHIDFRSKPFRRLRSQIAP